ARIALDALGAGIPGAYVSRGVDQVDCDVLDSEHELEVLLLGLAQRISALFHATPESLVQGGQLLLRLHVRGDIAKAPDAADLLLVDELHPRQALVYASVAHAQLIEGFERRGSVDLVDARAVCRRVFQ